MTAHRTITATATAPIRFGSFVAVNDENGSPDPARVAVGGVAKRPHQAGPREGYERGDTVVVLTDGGVRADLADGQRWVEVKSGRIASG